jgi:hypothetical protein
MPPLGRLTSLALRAALISTMGVAAAGCSGAKSKPASSGATSGLRDTWGTVWLCRPGEANNPCLSDLATTVVGRNGAVNVERLSPTKNPPIDCFYVYPTISGEATVNANLSVGFRERVVATAQAARFSQVCRVYAPVYRQITLSALDHPKRITLRNALIAYDSVLAAFHTYLAHYNHRRGIVFIGHSQGAAILIRLIKQEVDSKPTMRKRLVSALLLGGNLTVPRGRGVGGDFAHIPACRSFRQTGCVVAYSSFTGKPPNNSQFGRTTSDAGVALLAPHRPSPGLQIMCVNPASPDGGTARLDPAVPSIVLALLQIKNPAPVTTPWVAFPGLFDARCESAGNASWLQITAIGRGAGRSLLTRLQDPALGLHVLDVTIALDDLVRLVRDQVAAFSRR